MTNQLEVRDFEYFLVLAQVLHFKKAALHLNITQSALSQKIRRLESLLGKELFIRTSRKVALSKAGKLFRKEAQIIVNQIYHSMERWTLSTDGIEGLLRIGFVGSAMRHYLPPILQTFISTHPNIKFYLDDASNQYQIDNLENNNLDIGFIRSANVPAFMTIKSVYEECFSVVLPKSHPVTKRNFRDMSVFSEESFILWPSQASEMYFQKILDICRDAGFSPNISHRALHGPSIFKLVESGLGVSIVPSSLKDEKNYQIRFIDLVDIPQRTELFAVWNSDHSNEALDYLLELL